MSLDVAGASVPLSLPLLATAGPEEVSRWPGQEGAAAVATSHQGGSASLTRETNLIAFWFVVVAGHDIRWMAVLYSTSVCSRHRLISCILLDMKSVVSCLINLSSVSASWCSSLPPNIRHSELLLPITGSTAAVVSIFCVALRAFSPV